MKDVLSAIRKVAADDPTADPLDLARSVLSGLRKDDLLPLIAREIKDAQRFHSRTVERAFFDRGFRAAVEAVPSPEEARAVALGDFMELYNTRFRLGDGTSVTWGQATIEQHEIRLAMLRKLRAGLDRTIEQHERALVLLRTSGAPCLEEVREIA